MRCEDSDRWKLSEGHDEKRGQSEQSEEVEELAGIRLEADIKNSDHIEASSMANEAAHVGTSANKRIIHKPHQMVSLVRLLAGVTKASSCSKEGENPCSKVKTPILKC